MSTATVSSQCTFYLACRSRLVYFPLSSRQDRLPQHPQPSRWARREALQQLLAGGRLWWVRFFPLRLHLNLVVLNGLFVVSSVSPGPLSTPSGRPLFPLPSRTWLTRASLLVSSGKLLSFSYYAFYYFLYSLSASFPPICFIPPFRSQINDLYDFFLRLFLFHCHFSSQCASFWH